MINSFSNEGSLVFQFREVTRKKNEAFMRHVSSFANNPARPVMADASDASYDGFIRDYGEDIPFGEDTISIDGVSFIYGTSGVWSL